MGAFKTKLMSLKRKLHFEFKVCYVEAPDEEPSEGQQPNLLREDQRLEREHVWGEQHLYWTARDQLLAKVQARCEDDLRPVNLRKLMEPCISNKFTYNLGIDLLPQSQG